MGDFLVESHDWLRRELIELRRQLDAVIDGSAESAEIAHADLGLAQQLRSHCLEFCSAVEEHHTGEDMGAFPMLAKERPELAEDLEKLGEEHKVVGRMQEDSGSSWNPTSRMKAIPFDCGRTSNPSRPSSKRTLLRGEDARRRAQHRGTGAGHPANAPVVVPGAGNHHRPVRFDQTSSVAVIRCRASAGLGCCAISARTSAPVSACALRCTRIIIPVLGTGVRTR